MEPIHELGARFMVKTPAVVVHKHFNGCQAAQPPPRRKRPLPTAIGIEALEALAGAVITARPSCTKAASLFVDRLTIARDRLLGMEVWA